MTKPRLRAVSEIAPAQPGDGIPLAADAPHAAIARYFLVDRELRCGAKPIGAEGQLWCPDARGLWQGEPVDRLAVEIGDTFKQFKTCRKVGDYRGIAAHIVAAADGGDFFTAAPVGLVTPAGFWALSGGKVARESLRPDHRQRFELPFDPDFEGEPKMLFRLLAEAFAGDSPDEQADLAAEMLGAALFGLAARLQRAFLFYGVARSGKSTLLEIARSMFPDRFVAAISPARWSHEYFAGGLAGRRANFVGELPDDQAIPAAAFKNVLGGDPVEARHPSHRPFSFVNEAAHFFCSNHPIGTTDRTDGFYRRWVVLRFANAVPAEAVDPDLAARIIADELPAVLAWAMRGAERVAAAQRYSSTPAHEQFMRQWRVGSNPVLRFLTDPDYVELDAKATEPSSAVYLAFRTWAQAQGNRPMSSQAFAQLMDDTSGGLGVHRVRTGGARSIRGLKLVSLSQGFL
jgi:P4 family phage/plasmid primase-like protien